MAQEVIVVGVNAARAASTPALDWAVAECALRSARLDIVHSVESADAPCLTGPSSLVDPVRDELAQVTLIESRERAEIGHPRLPVETLLSHAPAADALIDASNSASLLVLGADESVGLAQSILGSTLQRVVVHSQCPVVVVPVAPPRPARPRIIVGLSPTRAGRAALRFALEEAVHRGCPVTGVLAGIDIAATDLSQLARTVAAEYPGIAFDTILMADAPAAAIVELAHSATLVVLGCHHSSDRWSCRLGSVPAAVLEQTACPVALLGQLG